MDLIKSMEISGLPVKDIIENPSMFVDNPEVIGTVLDGLKELGKQLREHQTRLTGVLSTHMQDIGATKMKIVGSDGKEKSITLSNGSYSLQYKPDEVESIIKKHGFQPSQLGSYVFQMLPWKECKQIRKQGGEIQELIDFLYQEGVKVLKLDKFVLL